MNNWKIISLNIHRWSPLLRTSSADLSPDYLFPFLSPSKIVQREHSSRQQSEKSLSLSLSLERERFFTVLLTPRNAQTHTSPPRPVSVIRKNSNSHNPRSIPRVNIRATNFIYDPRNRLPRFEKITPPNRLINSLPGSAVWAMKIN